MAKKQKSPPFVMISKALLKDKTFRSLSSSAKVLYFYMRNKLNGIYGLNVVLTYKEMNDVIKPEAFRRAARELMSSGFIKLVEGGGLYGKANVYQFIGEYRHYFYKGSRIG